MAQILANFIDTHLTAALTASATSMTVDSVAGWPTLDAAENDFIVIGIDSGQGSTAVEIVHVTAYTSGGVCTITRGREDTAAVAHASGTRVEGILTVGALEAAIAQEAIDLGVTAPTQPVFLYDEVHPPAPVPSYDPADGYGDLDADAAPSPGVEFYVGQRGGTMDTSDYGLVRNSSFLDDPSLIIGESITTIRVRNDLYNDLIAAGWEIGNTLILATVGGDEERVTTSPYFAPNAISGWTLFTIAHDQGDDPVSDVGFNYVTAYATQLDLETPRNWQEQPGSSYGSTVQDGAGGDVDLTDDEVELRIPADDFLGWLGQSGSGYPIRIAATGGDVLTPEPDRIRYTRTFVYLEFDADFPTDVAIAEDTAAFYEPIAPLYVSFLSATGVVNDDGTVTWTASATFPIGVDEHFVGHATIYLRVGPGSTESDAPAPVVGYNGAQFTGLGAWSFESPDPDGGDVWARSIDANGVDDVTLGEPIKIHAQPVEDVTILIWRVVDEDDSAPSLPSPGYDGSSFGSLGSWVTAQPDPDSDEDMYAAAITASFVSADANSQTWSVAVGERIQVADSGSDLALGFAFSEDGVEWHGTRSDDDLYVRYWSPSAQAWSPPSPIGAHEDSRVSLLGETVISQDSLQKTIAVAAFNPDQFNGYELHVLRDPSGHANRHTDYVVLPMPRNWLQNGPTARYDDIHDGTYYNVSAYEDRTNLDSGEQGQARWWGPFLVLLGADAQAGSVNGITFETIPTGIAKLQGFDRRLLDYDEAAHDEVPDGNFLDALGALDNIEAVVFWLRGHRVSGTPTVVDLRIAWQSGTGMPIHLALMGERIV